MSSEESDTERNENGIERTVFCVKKLPRERKKMRKIKTKLRKIYDDNQTHRMKLSLVPRKRTDILSDRGAPHDAPAWAVRKEPTNENE